MERCLQEGKPSLEKIKQIRANLQSPEMNSRISHKISKMVICYELVLGRVLKYENADCGIILVELNFIKSVYLLMNKREIKG